MRSGCGPRGVKLFVARADTAVPAAALLRAAKGWGFPVGTPRLTCRSWAAALRIHAGLKLPVGYVTREPQYASSSEASPPGSVWSLAALADLAAAASTDPDEWLNAEA